MTICMMLKSVRHLQSEAEKKWQRSFWRGRGMLGREAFHTIHNYIDIKEMILRKGAIAAHKGEKSADSD